MMKAGAIKKPATPPQTPPHGRLGPIKASHQMCTQTANKQCTNELCDIHKTKAVTAGTADSQVNTPLDRANRPSSVMSSSSASDLKLGSQPSAANRLVAETPTHVTIRTGTLPNSKMVKVGSIPLSHADVVLHTPSPPSSSKPRSSRPGSAQRFRRMVMECRDGH